MSVIQRSMVSPGAAAAGSVSGFFFFAVVHAVAQVLARLEMRHIFTRQRHGVTGLGVAAHARRTEMQREAAETTDLYAPAGGQGTAHPLQDHLHGQFDVLGSEMTLLPRYEFDQLRL